MPTLRTWAAASSGESVTRKSTSSGAMVPSLTSVPRMNSSSGFQNSTPMSTSGKWLIFPVWDERRRLGHFVQRPEAAGHRDVHEHDLAHEEVAKRHPPVEVGVGLLLLGQLD